MKKTQIVVEYKNKLENSEKFRARVKDKLDFLINEGYEIKASNLVLDNVYSYIYVLLQKD